MKSIRYILLPTVRNYYTSIDTFVHQTPIKNKKPPKKKTSVKKPRINNAPKIDWTDQQLKIIDAVERRESVFFTGSAGTGKTILLQHLIKMLERIHGKSKVFKTAPTGVAACALRGQTLHSFAGVGLGEADAETLLAKVLSSRWTLKRWEQVKALVIDEISMVDGELFDKLEYIAKNIKSKSGECDRPWGGIQLLVAGDFLQLPPVAKNCDDSEFAFEAECWERTFQSQVELGTVFRQSDAELIKMLLCIRKGEIDSESIELLKQQCSSDEEPDETVVRLFPRTREVERVNRMRLSGLGEEIIVYNALDRGEDHWKSQLNLGIAPSKLELSKGARVMLTKNLNVKNKLVNGSTGTIVGFKKVHIASGGKICSRDGDKVLPIVKFDSGQEEVIKHDTWEVVAGDVVYATREQLPLLLAWAMSIHKSQGMTLDRLHTDLSGAFGCGMVYVALSRIKTLKGLTLSGFDPEKIEAHPKVLEYYKKNFDGQPMA